MKKITNINGLFNHGEFTLNSKKHSQFKINCDVLSTEDLDTIAYIISKYYTFAEVIGIPDRGNRLASSLVRYQKGVGSSETNTALIVDDVLTTGHSMNEARLKTDGWLPVYGVVLFARGPCPNWVKPVFQISSEFLL